MNTPEPKQVRVVALLDATHALHKELYMLNDNGQWNLPFVEIPLHQFDNPAEAATKAFADKYNVYLPSTPECIRIKELMTENFVVYGMYAAAQPARSGPLAASIRSLDTTAVRKLYGAMTLQEQRVIFHLMYWANAKFSTRPIKDFLAANPPFRLL